MMGAVHCEIFEVFKECKNLRINFSYEADEDSLQIFPNEEFP
jgi:hypothetical protein